MGQYLYKKLNAFASGSSAGNPAACLYLAESQELTHGEMQRIAKEHKGFVSEVVYCGKSDAADFRLVYYSSEGEVDFCGHGTVACMYSLVCGNEALRNKPQLTIETKKGLLTVYNEVPSQDAVFIAAPSPVYSDTGNIPARIAGALQTDGSNIAAEYPMGLINAGLSTFLVPLNSLEALLSLLPDEGKLKDFCLSNGIDIILAFSRETQDTRHRFHTRVFAPKYGYLEDPATGSGNSAFGYYMLRRGLWNGEDISLEQGPEKGAFNIVRLKCMGGRTVLFGGGAVTKIEGHYYA
jgi:PhzF family phenazine biosynthesis protein